MKADLRAALIIIAVLMFLGVLASIATTCGCSTSAKPARVATPATATPSPVAPLPDLSKLRKQIVPGIGALGGWHVPVTDAEIAAIAGEHVTMAELAEIRRKDAAAAAEVRQHDREGWWLLAVYSFSVLVGFVGLVAALYMRSTMFLVLPAAGLGTSFMAYLFLNAFVWLAWALVAVLAIAAGLGIWWLARHGGIMQAVATGAVKYAEEQKSHMPKKAREAMHKFAKDNHPEGISAVINDLRGKKKDATR